MQSEATTTPAPAPGEGVARRRFLFALPAAAFAGLAGLFAMSLGRDPSRVPSALIGRPAPEFSLPPVQGRTLGLSKADLLGTVSLVNVFASWCVECRAEHPLLMRLAQREDRADPRPQLQGRARKRCAMVEHDGRPLLPDRRRSRWTGRDRLGRLRRARNFRRRG